MCNGTEMTGIPGGVIVDDDFIQSEIGTDVIPYR